jgi:hypothetical protein
VWTDTTFDPQSMRPLDVPFLSEDYFALAASRPDVGAALALGPEVILVVDGVAYRTVGAEQAGDPFQVPAPVPPTDSPTSAHPEAPPVNNSGSRPSGANLPCAAGAIGLGACLAPVRERFLRRKGRGQRS